MKETRYVLEKDFKWNDGTTSTSRSDPYDTYEAAFYIFQEFYPEYSRIVKEVVEREVVDAKDPIENGDALDIKIDDISMSTGLYNILKNNSKFTLRDIFNTTVSEMKLFKGMGKLRFKELENLMQSKGIGKMMMMNYKNIKSNETLYVWASLDVCKRR